MPTEREIIDLWARIETLTAQIAALEGEREEAREIARSLLTALEGRLSLEVTRSMTAYQAEQAAERLRQFVAAREKIAAWPEVIVTVVSMPEAASPEQVECVACRLLIRKDEAVSAQGEWRCNNRFCASR